MRCFLAGAIVGFIVAVVGVYLDPDAVADRANARRYRTKPGTAPSRRSFDPGAALR